MPKKNTVSEIREGARLFRAASARILQSESAGELYYAATLCPSLCMRARSAAKNIASYKDIPAEAEELNLARTLAEDFLESGEEASEVKLMAFLAAGGVKYGSVTLAVLPDMLFTSAFLRVASLAAEGEETGLSYLLRTAERLHFVDFSRIFLAFSATVAAFSAEKAGVYASCDDKTKLKYVSALLALCRKENKREAEKAAELVCLADMRGVHVGTLIFPKRAYVPR
ncbi:MAG: hypothetical protein IJW21_04930, partial [Clostridia bacterium]|nr:hypothetical protein [Clostridia bacterium]